MITDYKWGHSHPTQYIPLLKIPWKSWPNPIHVQLWSPHAHICVTISSQLEAQLNDLAMPPSCRSRAQAHPCSKNPGGGASVLFHPFPSHPLFFPPVFFPLLLPFSPPCRLFPSLPTFMISPIFPSIRQNCLSNYEVSVSDLFSLKNFIGL